MSSYEAVLDLVDRIYIAAQDPSHWPAVVTAIADAARCPSASILYRNLRAQQGGVDVAVGVSPAATAAYQNYYHRLDPWGNSPKTPILVRPGAILDGDELVERAILQKTEYYSDFGQRHGLTRVLVGTIMLDGPFASVISLIRDDRAAPHGAEERRLLGALMPHLTRAMQMHRRLAPVSLLHGAAVDALDRLGTAVILLDECGRTMFVNRAAERILRARDGLQVEEGCLVAAGCQERDDLRCLILRAARTTAGQALHSGGAMSVARPSLRRPYHVLVTPLGRRHAAPDGQGAAVAVFVADPDDRAQSENDVLMRLFRLTPAEARLAAMLGTGVVLADAADALGIGRETARTQLRSVFAKTGTTRQAELVRVIGRACPLLGEV